MTGPVKCIICHLFTYLVVLTADQCAVQLHTVLRGRRRGGGSTLAQSLQRGQLRQRDCGPRGRAAVAGTD